MVNKSIFNDVIGPLTRGPSSSHTGGSYFIGVVTRNLFNEVIDSIDIFFDNRGSYGKVYKFQNSDLAFLAGLINIPMNSQKFFEVKKIAEERKISFQFHTIEIPNANHPNYVILRVSSKNGKKLEITAKSTGGGTIFVQSLNDWEISIDGQTFDLFLEFPSKNESEIQDFLDSESKSKKIKIHSVQRKTSSEKRSATKFLQIKLDEEIPQSWFTRLNSIANISIWKSGPVYFIMCGEQLFESAEQYLTLTKTKNLSLGEAAIEYEMTILKKSKQEVIMEMNRRVSIMLESVERGMTGQIEGMKTLSSSASKLSHASKTNNLFSNSHNTLAAIRAMAAMEVASSGGYVCAAPTGGSSGVIPAVLYTLHHDFQITHDKLIYCAFAAGGIGLIHALRSTFAAEVAGCQVEIGIAGAMAAAAVCESAGAPSGISMDAASICLQNTMGSVCDLVAGICEIPCHTRNAVAASNAFVCCDLVLGGYSNHITLDDSIDASDSSGKMLPSELRCTALGGIAVTPSALKLYKEEEE